MGEEALLEVEPYALDRVQFGRVGRQRHQRDAAWNAKRARTVPPCLVEHHCDVLIIADRRGKTIEELLHRLRVHVRHDEREGVIGAGLHGCEDVGEREPLVANARRALAASPPDVARAPLLPDPCLVLEEQADALFICMLKFSQKSRGSF